ncbi:hypothetical protein KMW28_12955 [Flammeovirga yaeyamensis]|uniref:Outer membrane protein beta-barrel domain-containing protein n=1 Tax=Flammeovirga yaeyamensis TaxID=367791 RepID=A0AAX1MZJ5_9BACT|nr:hypothetical protein [Flammeovirga yaeyamensis]MBB3695920.1 hypothetical protein [Flammeovirga yaeyamensis]NMF34609.1 hypothetical protein [Flammeovirga yaeyamensis]QWG00561.1 hypothetical protein KMW28_12955 [Flammeovirga yaeyamensis]
MKTTFFLLIVLFSVPFTTFGQTDSIPVIYSYDKAKLHEVLKSSDTTTITVNLIEKETKTVKDTVITSSESSTYYFKLYSDSIVTENVKVSLENEKITSIGIKDSQKRTFSYFKIDSIESYKDLRYKPLFLKANNGFYYDFSNEIYSYLLENENKLFQIKNDKVKYYSFVKSNTNTNLISEIKINYNDTILYAKNLDKSLSDLYDNWYSIEVDNSYDSLSRNDSTTANSDIKKIKLSELISSKEMGFNESKIKNKDTFLEGSKKNETNEFTITGTKGYRKEKIKSVVLKIRDNLITKGHIQLDKQLIKMGRIDYKDQIGEKIYLKPNKTSDGINRVENSYFHINEVFNIENLETNIEFKDVKLNQENPSFEIKKVNSIDNYITGTAFTDVLRLFGEEENTYLSTEFNSRISLNKKHWKATNNRFLFFSFVDLKFRWSQFDDDSKYQIIDRSSTKNQITNENSDQFSTQVGGDSLQNQFSQIRFNQLSYLEVSAAINLMKIKLGSTNFSINGGIDQKMSDVYFSQDSVLKKVRAYSYFVEPCLEIYQDEHFVFSGRYQFYWQSLLGETEKNHYQFYGNTYFDLKYHPNPDKNSNSIYARMMVMHDWGNNKAFTQMQIGYTFSIASWITKLD